MDFLKIVVHEDAHSSFVHNSNYLNIAYEFYKENDSYIIVIRSLDNSIMHSILKLC